MYKLVSLAAAAASLAMIGAPAAAEAALGPDANACQAGSGKTAFLVNVSGFKATSGKVRVQVYGDNAADFLAKGKKLRRIEVPVTGTRMPICIAVPSAGRYAIAVRHDVKNNGSDWNDGGGFSRNPHISLTSPKPKYGQVSVQHSGGVKAIDVVMQYRQGLSIGPIKKAG